MTKYVHSKKVAKLGYNVYHGRREPLWRGAADKDALIAVNRRSSLMTTKGWRILLAEILPSPLGAMCNDQRLLPIKVKTRSIDKIPSKARFIDLPQNYGNQTPSA